jgi:rubrerythrin
LSEWYPGKFIEKVTKGRGFLGQRTPEEQYAIELIKSDLDMLIKDEQDAIRAYSHMQQLYGTYGWRRIFGNILADEQKHLQMLTEAKRAVEESEEEQRKLV